MNDAFARPVIKRKWLSQIMDKGQKRRLRRNVARAKRAGRTYAWPDAAALRPERGLSDARMLMPLRHKDPQTRKDVARHVASTC